MLSKKADEDGSATDSLLPFIQNNQPKFLTKEELRSAAMRELNLSKHSFDMRWTWRSKIIVAMTGTSRRADDYASKAEPASLLAAADDEAGYAAALRLDRRARH